LGLPVAGNMQATGVIFSCIGRLGVLLDVKSSERQLNHGDIDNAGASEYSERDHVLAVLYGIKEVDAWFVHRDCLVLAVTNR
jgi:hypothetical protein